MRKKILGLLVFFVFVSSYSWPRISYSQINEEVFLGVEPEGRIEKKAIDLKVKKYAEYIKRENLYGLDRLVPYQAAALGSSLICENVYNPEYCREKTRDLLDAYNFAIGRCSAFDEGAGRDFCEALRSNDCSGYAESNQAGEGSGPDKIFCKALVNLDIELFKKAIPEEELEEEKRGFAYYSVFKTGRVSFCLNLLEEDAYFYRVGCYILASSFPQQVIQRYALDFAYYYYSDREGKQVICKKIEDPYLRKYCQEGFNFSDFVENRFLSLKK